MEKGFDPLANKQPEKNLGAGNSEKSLSGTGNAAKKAKEAKEPLRYTGKSEFMEDPDNPGFLISREEYRKRMQEKRGD